MSDFLHDKGRLTETYNTADTLRAGTAPGLISLVDNVTRGGGHVFFGEPHTDGMIIKQYETLAENYGIFRAAAHNGVKHLALEFPSGFQPDIDDYMAGKVTRDEFKDIVSTKFTSGWLETEQDKEAFSENLTRTISNARAAGMKVHAADVTTGDMIDNHEPSPEVLAWNQYVTQKYVRDNPQMSLEDYATQEFKKLPRDEQEKLNTKSQEFLNNGQFKKFANDEEQEAARHKRLDDFEQYAYLRERIPHGEGIMGVVGLSHLDNSLDEKRNLRTRGIDDYLAEEGGKVTTIEMHTSGSKKTMEDMYAQSGVRAVDPPDYTVILDQKAIIAAEDRQIGRLDRPLRDPEGTMVASHRNPGMTALLDFK